MYDLKKDLEELKKIYDNPDYAKIQKQLHKKLKKITERTKRDKYIGRFQENYS